MNRSLLIAILTFITVSVVSAQAPDYTVIKERTLNPSSEYYYPVLLKKLKSLDTSLTKEDFRYLFYGFIFSKKYDPYEQADIEKKIKEINLGQDFPRAQKLCDSLLSVNPVSLTALFEKSFSTHAQGKDSLEYVSRSMYNALLRAAISSGDGKTPETAIHVISINDENEIMLFWGIKIKAETRMSKDGQTYDVFELAKNKLGMKYLFFNVTMLQQRSEEIQLEKLLKK